MSTQVYARAVYTPSDCLYTDNLHPPRRNPLRLQRLRRSPSEAFQPSPNVYGSEKLVGCHEYQENADKNRCCPVPNASINRHRFDKRGLSSAGFPYHLYVGKPITVLYPEDAIVILHVICFANCTNINVAEPCANTWEDVYRLVKQWHPNYGPVPKAGARSELGRCEKSARAKTQSVCVDVPLSLAIPDGIVQTRRAARAAARACRPT
jgi:hypothetical protein